MNLATDDKYVKLFKNRPNDIIGRYIRLEALEVDRHLEGLYNLTSGDAGLENKSFDPEEIWGFLEDGPFEDAKAMRNSFIFMHLMNEAAFAIVNNITDKLMGCILLSKDDPQNLTIQLEPPLMQPTQEGSRELLESCFLLMDRLFAYGYRRLQISIDALDSDKRKLAMRLGFTLEGILYKHMVVKESSRDSNIYGLLNSDWKRGARVAIFKKLYGDAAFRVDSMNEKKEEEFDEQTRVLKEQKRTEQENALLIRNKKV
jgi:RimJ/RimL family protein N-acetyltransferase